MEGWAHQNYRKGTLFLEILNILIAQKAIHIPFGRNLWLGITKPEQIKH